MATAPSDGTTTYDLMCARQLTRRRRWTRALGLSSALAVMGIVLVVASWRGTWDWYSASLPWIGSTPGDVRHYRAERHLMLGQGTLVLHSMVVYRMVPFDAAGELNSPGLAWATTDHMFRSQWTPLLRWPGGPRGGSIPEIAVPTWMIAALLTGTTAVVWRRWRRAGRIGSCDRCGYCVKALTDGAPCPECGGPVA